MIWRGGTRECEVNQAGSEFQDNWGCRVSSCLNTKQNNNLKTNFRYFLGWQQRPLDEDWGQWAGKSLMVWSENFPWTCFQGTPGSALAQRLYLCHKSSLRVAS